ncbi:MAG: baseplate J/gp47 family protein [Pyrinomonadaceae bacterium]
MYEELEKPLRELARGEPLAARARKLAESTNAADPNGIKLVEVSVNNATDTAVLDVHFYNHNHLSAIDDSITPAASIFAISGGTRVRGGRAVGQVQVTSITTPFPPRPILRLTVTPIGDYSTYSLSIVASSVEGPPAENTNVLFDPLFAEIRFKFRPGCFNNNCAPEWEAALEPPDEPVIDYMAKDYGSFRDTMITAMSVRVPEWQPTSEADLDMVLAELFSVAADELSDYQDRVMNEAYLARLRKRVSLARHARLMDYHIHQGNQASTWLALEIEHDGPAPAPKSFRLTPDIPTGKELKVWAGNSNVATTGDTTETDSSVVFLMHDQTQVHQYLNNIGLYTWEDTITTLKAGSTRADLVLYDNLYLDDLSAVVEPRGESDVKAIAEEIRDGVFTRLLIQEHLNPQTGMLAGVNPEKRQLLNLIPDTAVAMHDPVTDTWFLRVNWEKTDALKYNYCFTVDCPADNPGTAIGTVRNVSLFHGNLVEIFHGRRETNIYKDEGVPLDIDDPDQPLQFHYERTRWGAICRLPEIALAYQTTKTGGDVAPLSTLKVTVDSTADDPWNEVPNFIHSDDSAEGGDHYVVETDENRRSLIRFGNGVNGRELPDGAVVTATYQYGMPLDGNVGLDRIVNFDTSTIPNAVLDLRQCWNPFDVKSGLDREPAHEIVRRVPEAYRSNQLRAVTLADYVARAENIDGVSRVAARYAWTGSWRTVRVTIDPEGTSELSYQLRKKVADELDAIRLIGDDLEIRPPAFVPLEISVVLCTSPHQWWEDVKFVLEQEFSSGWTPDGRKGFFHPDLWTFGQPLHASEIVGRALQVKGVVHAVPQGVPPISVSIKRWNSPSAPTESLTNLNHNEIILVMNDPDHQERGSIRFFEGVKA